VDDTVTTTGDIDPDTAAEHVAGILFDASAEPEPGCLICQRASELELWQGYGFGDPLADAP